jgi:hypothetical protein
MAITTRAPPLLVDDYLVFNVINFIFQSILFTTRAIVFWARTTIDFSDKRKIETLRPYQWGCCCRCYLLSSSSACHYPYWCPCRYFLIFLLFHLLVPCFLLTIVPIVYRHLPWYSGVLEVVSYCFLAVVLYRSLPLSFSGFGLYLSTLILVLLQCICVVKYIRYFYSQSLSVCLLSVSAFRFFVYLKSPLLLLLLPKVNLHSLDLFCLP